MNHLAAQPPIPIRSAATVLVGALALAGLAFSRGNAAELVSFQYDGRTRNYLITVPVSYDGTTAVPLVLALHPALSNGEQFRTNACRGEWDAKAGSETLIVVYPNGTSGVNTYPTATALTWNSFTFDGSGVNDVGFLLALIARVKAAYRIDERRVYMCGFSNGAMMTNTMAILHPEVLAAIGPVSGGWMSAYCAPDVAEGLRPSRPMPTWIWRGSRETMQTGPFPQTRDVQDQAQKAWWIDRNHAHDGPTVITDPDTVTEIWQGGRYGTEVRFTEVQGTSHQWQPGATDGLCEFFLGRALEQPPKASTWADRVAGTDADAVRGVSVDRLGYVYTAGSFCATAEVFGVGLVSAGQADILVAKLDSRGNLVWLRQFGAAGRDFAFDIVVDASGSPVLTGSFSDTVVFDDWQAISRGGLDTFILRLSAENGAVQWLATGGGQADDGGNEIAADPAGGTVVIGNAYSSVTFGSTTLPGQGGRDIFVLRYAADGSLCWAKQIASAGEDYGRAAACSPDGDILVAGMFTGSLALAGQTLTAAGGSDILVVRYTPDGSLRWARGFGGASDDYARAIGADATGNVYVSGVFAGTTAFNAVSLTARGGNDIFLLGIAPDGAPRWARGIGGPDRDEGSEIEVDPAGYIHLAGSFSDTMQCGAYTLTSAGSLDVFVASFTPDGICLSAQRCGGTGEDQAYAIARDAARDTLVCCGHYTAPFNIGAFSLASAGDLDGFLCAFRGQGDLPPPDITSPFVAEGRTGDNFAYQITASGDPTSFSASGLPLGLSLDAATGAITGVPGTAGEYRVSMVASNTSGTGGACLRLRVLAIPRTICMVIQPGHAWTVLDPLDAVIDPPQDGWQAVHVQRDQTVRLAATPVENG